MEEQREQIKVQQQLLSKKEAVSKLGADVCGRGAHTLGGNRTPQPQDEALNTVTKNGPVDAASHHCKISKVTSCLTIKFPLPCIVSVVGSFTEQKTELS